MEETEAIYNCQLDHFIREKVADVDIFTWSCTKL